MDSNDKTTSLPDHTPSPSNARKRKRTDAAHPTASSPSTRRTIPNEELEQILQKLLITVDNGGEPEQKDLISEFRKLGYSKLLAFYRFIVLKNRKTPLLHVVLPIITTLANTKPPQASKSIGDTDTSTMSALLKDLEDIYLSEANISKDNVTLALQILAQCLKPSTKDSVNQNFSPRVIIRLLHENHSKLIERLTQLLPNFIVARNQVQLFFLLRCLTAFPKVFTESIIASKGLGSLFEAVTYYAGELRKESIQDAALKERTLVMVASLLESIVKVNTGVGEAVKLSHQFLDTCFLNVVNLIWNSMNLERLLEMTQQSSNNGKSELREDYCCSKCCYMHRIARHYLGAIQVGVYSDISLRTALLQPTWNPISKVVDFLGVYLRLYSALLVGDYTSHRDYEKSIAEFPYIVRSLCGILLCVAKQNTQSLVTLGEKVLEYVGEFLQTTLTSQEISVQKKIATLRPSFINAVLDLLIFLSREFKQQTITPTFFNILVRLFVTISHADYAQQYSANEAMLTAGKNVKLLFFVVISSSQLTSELESLDDGVESDLYSALGVWIERLWDQALGITAVEHHKKEEESPMLSSPTAKLNNNQTPSSDILTRVLRLLHIFVKQHQPRQRIFEQGSTLRLFMSWKHIPFLLEHRNVELANVYLSLLDNFATDSPIRARMRDNFGCVQFLSELIVVSYCDGIDKNCDDEERRVYFEKILSQALGILIKAYGRDQIALGSLTKIIPHAHGGMQKEVLEKYGSCFRFKVGLQHSMIPVFLKMTLSSEFLPNGTSHQHAVFLPDSIRQQCLTILDSLANMELGRQQLVSLPDSLRKLSVFYARTSLVGFENLIWSVLKKVLTSPSLVNELVRFNDFEAVAMPLLDYQRKYRPQVKAQVQALTKAPSLCLEETEESMSLRSVSNSSTVVKPSIQSPIKSITNTSPSDRFGTFVTALHDSSKSFIFDILVRLFEYLSSDSLGLDVEMETVNSSPLSPQSTNTLEAVAYAMGYCCPREWWSRWLVTPEGTEGPVLKVVLDGLYSNDTLSKLKSARVISFMAFLAVDNRCIADSKEGDESTDEEVLFVEKLFMLKQNGQSFISIRDDSQVDSSSQVVEFIVPMNNPGNERIMSTRSLIANASPAFEAMLFGEYAEGQSREILIGDIPFQDFQNFVSLTHLKSRGEEVLQQLSSSAITHPETMASYLAELLGLLDLSERYLMVSLRNAIVKCVIRALDRVTNGAALLGVLKRERLLYPEGDGLGDQDDSISENSGYHSLSPLRKKVWQTIVLFLDELVVHQDFVDAFLRGVLGSEENEVKFNIVEEIVHVLSSSLSL